ncbi:prostacyclin receptor-like [Actinia tenebrosa]|uniref:Prostacyclin receptor-like n=1 Tax=Actinia tenebrosa TaxID=6105 RepID=A0A6P8IGD8_ACTTE|nr:prostacyclin receptor-like [Actinia tenebrosa]
MAIDRTVSLCKPFFYKTAASPSLARAICVAIVTICLLVASLPFMGIGNYILSQTGSYVCHIDLYSSSPKDRVFIIILGLIAVAVVTTMLTSNIVVFYLVWKLKKSVCRIFPLELNRNSRRKNNKCIAAKKEQQMAQFVASVSLIFLLTWLPLTVRLFCNYFEVLPNKTLDLVAMKIALSGFIANPFAYVLFRNIFKRTLKRSFSQIQTGIGNKINVKPQSNKIFHIKVSRIHRENSTVEPSKFVTDMQHAT